MPGRARVHSFVRCIQLASVFALMVCGGTLVIYGVGLLAGCYLSGIFLGDLLGKVIGVQANVGGVGIAMLFLILASDALIRRGRLKPQTREGVIFWSAIYIPVIVAVAAKPTVIAALKRGPMALVAGAGEPLPRPGVEDL
jgi:malonate transporter MadL subunit